MIAENADAPSPYDRAHRVRVGADLLDDRDVLDRVVADLHRRWVAREPYVVELAVSVDDLRRPETSTRPPWHLGGGFSFLRERLLFLVWHNAWDLRGDEPVWWWAHKAERAGATPGGPADVMLPDGRPAWIDGGPRGPVGVDEPVVHSDTVSLGRLDPVPAHVSPESDGLAADQLAAVGHVAGPARIIAPAGSGKTRTLIARLRHLTAERAIEPETLCVVAYNARAAAELRDRMGDPRLQIRTIHSLGWEILRQARPGVRLIDEAAQRARLDPLVTAPRRPNTDTVGPYLEALGDVRVGLRDPAEVEASRDDVPDLPQVVSTYQEVLLERGEADHDSQIAGAIEALCTDPALRRHWQARCRHLLVDEFQDLTPGYLLLLRLVASPGLDVFGVGDDDQTIYGYAGATPDYLLGYGDVFPGASEYALEVNYRCPIAVTEGAATLLGYNQRRIDKTIRPGEDADPDPAALVEQLHPSSRLAVACADLVGGWLDVGADPVDVAVLCRVNSALLPVHAALADRSIPFTSPLDARVLRRTALRAVLAWLRIGLDPSEIHRDDLFEAVRRPSRGLTRATSQLLGRRRRLSLSTLMELGERLPERRRDRWDGFCSDLWTVHRAVQGGDLAHVLDVIIDQVGLAGSAAALDAGRSRADRSAQSDDLVALRRAAALHPDPTTFEEWLRARLAASASGDGVALTTVHRVKGMEWPRVVVYGADRGLMPHDLADDWEEERRVFHVALTRARSRAVILADQERPSPFLAELAGTAARAATSPRAATPTLVEPSAPREADPALVERLKAWRWETARARNVPAYVILHDATLDELARRKPGSDAELAKVSGIGPAKLDAYGDDLLAILADA